MIRLARSLVLSILILSFFLLPVPQVAAHPANTAPAIPSSSMNSDIPLAYYATLISSGWYHTCALMTTGGVRCWGRNDDGQLGNNTWSHSSIWVDVWSGPGNSAPLSGVVSLVTGSYHTCGLMANGTVKCWGYNSYGQLGNNSWAASATPVDVVTSASDATPLSGVVAITAGNSDTCALMAGGAVKCWGFNAFGQLGNNATTNSNVPVNVTGLSSGVYAISAGGYHTCALTYAGVKCWGYNNTGQLGNNAWADSHVPVDVWTGAGDATPLNGVRSIATGTYHTCVVTNSGIAKCWGSNSYGELGRNSYTPSPVAVDVWSGAGDSTPLNSVSAMTAGENHTCALTTSGGLKCWGSGEQSQIGTSSTTPVPVDMNGLTAGVSAVAAGRRHTCFVTAYGGVMCVGDNSYGQLGNNTTTTSPWPVNVMEISSGGASVLGAGTFFSCAVTSGGGVKCWGLNDHGQLGNNSTTSSPVPVDVWTSASNSTPLSGVRAIAAGYQHTCALMRSGGVKCWGYNASGQLGNLGGESHVPVDVSGLGNVSAIGTGEFHSCALTTDGGVKCWGSNNFGQLGNNSTTNSPAPVDVWTGAGNSTPLSDVRALSVGYPYTCALVTGGSVKCWGSNNFGQLGNNSTTGSLVPIDVWTSASNPTPLSGVRGLTAGLYHTCALTTSGGGKCWGWNSYGQLGNNSTTSISTPVDVWTSASDATPLSGVTMLSAGGFDTCALVAGGAKCWGWNAGGELGNNSTTDSPVPVDVSGLGSGLSAVHTGHRHVCALTAGGAVKCWGENGSGELGNGLMPTTSLVPVQTVGLLSSALPVVQLAANPFQSGQAVTFTAAVAHPPVDALSGTVQFQVDGANLGAPVSLASGSATSPSTTLAIGLHRITAIYSGDSSHNLSRSASVVQAITLSTNADLSSLVLSSGTLVPAFAPATTAYSANVPYTVTSITVTPTAAHTAATITVNGTATASGSASSPISLDIGDNLITIVVTAQDGITTKTYTVLVTRARIQTITTLASSANPSLYGTAVTFTAAISPVPAGGTVRLRVDGFTISSCEALALTGGQATCTTNALSAGEHIITAEYSGDATHDASTSPGLAQAVCSSALTVTSQADSGAGSLRQALADVCAGGTISFNADLAGQTISLTSSPLTIAKDLTIYGLNTSPGVTISGGSSVRVFYVNSGVTFHLNQLSVKQGAGDLGGGLYNAGGTVDVTNSTFSSNNASTSGGGIYNAGGTLNLTNSTFSGNSASNSGGGIYNASGTVDLTNTTFSGNAASGTGGGIYNAGTLNLKNGVIANSPSGGDCFTSSSISVNINNLIEDGTCSQNGVNFLSNDPRLGPLANNSGPTPTHALFANSPLIDTGDPATCAAPGVSSLDQRGQARIDWQCDIGAFELKDTDSHTVTKAVSGPGTYSYGPTMVKMEVTDTHACLDGVTVVLTNTNHPTATLPLQTGHWWRIEPTPDTCTGFDVSLTLPTDFTPDGEDKVCRWIPQNHSWDCSMSSFATTGILSIRRDHVDHFSEWAVGDNSGPTTIRMLTFDASSQPTSSAWLAGLMGIVGLAFAALWQKQHRSVTRS